MESEFKLIEDINPTKTTVFVRESMIFCNFYSNILLISSFNGFRICQINTIIK